MHNAKDAYYDAITANLHVLAEFAGKLEPEHWNHNDAVNLEMAVLAIAFHLRKLAEHRYLEGLKQVQFNEVEITYSLANLCDVLVHSRRFETGPRFAATELEVESDRGGVLRFGLLDFATKVERLLEENR